MRSLAGTQLGSGREGPAEPLKGRALSTSQSPSQAPCLPLSVWRDPRVPTHLKLGKVALGSQADGPSLRFLDRAFAALAVEDRAVEEIAQRLVGHTILGPGSLSGPWSKLTALCPASAVGPQSNSQHWVHRLWLVGGAMQPQSLLSTTWVPIWALRGLRWNLR